MTELRKHKMLLRHMNLVYYRQKVTMLEGAA